MYADCIVFDLEIHLMDSSYLMVYFINIQEFFSSKLLSIVTFLPPEAQQALFCLYSNSYQDPDPEKQCGLDCTGGQDTRE